MIKLKKSGVFVFENKKGKEKLKKEFKNEMYKRGNSYYIKGTKDNYIKLKIKFADFLEPSCHLYPLIEKSKNENLKPSTRDLYFYVNKRFLEFSKKSPENVNFEDIRRYIRYLKKEGKQNSTLNTTVNALKFFYENSLDIDTFSTLKTETRKQLPKIFSRQEIYELIKSIDNPKHRLLIEIAYSCGLKLSELRRIKVSDIDLGKKIIYVRDKNLKVVRSVPISDSLAEKIKSYITSYYRDKDGYSDYLFFSESKKNKTGKITERTIEKIFKNSLTKSGVDGSFTFNNLRDSFVVHLLEMGYPVERIMKILGVTKNNFYKRYNFFIKAVQNLSFPDLLDFKDIEPALL